MVLDCCNSLLFVDSETLSEQRKGSGVVWGFDEHIDWEGLLKSRAALNQTLVGDLHFNCVKRSINI